MSPVGVFGAGRKAARRFRQDRRSSTAVEFALVGLLYFFLLIFALEGGIFYLRTTVLDLATEQAARAIMINQVAGNTTGSPAAPTTAAAFIQLIENDSYGVLTQANIEISVQMAAPVTGTVAAPVGGFQSIKPVATPAGLFQYVAGTCTVTYKTTSVNGGAATYSPPTASTCEANGICTTANFTLLPTDGEVSGGTDVTTTVGTTVTNTYTGATYSCSGGQDIVVQAQYTDTALSALVGYLFGPITSTLAFQVEPATT